MDGAAFVDVMLSDPSAMLEARRDALRCREDKLTPLTRDHLLLLPLLRLFPSQHVERLLSSLKPVCLERSAMVVSAPA